MDYAALPAGLNELSQKIIGYAYNVHTALGPGLLESTYKECLFYEIAKSGILIEKRKGVTTHLQRDYIKYRLPGRFISGKQINH